MGTSNHPEVPWSYTYLMNRLREKMQDETLANWKKSYVQKTSFGLKLCLHEDVNNNYISVPPMCLSNLITEAGWEYVYVDITNSYKEFSLNAKLER